MHHNRTLCAAFCGLYIMCTTALLPNNSFAAGFSQNSPESGAQCLRAVDRAVLHIDEADIAFAQHGLSTLAVQCEHVPQVHHNIGVLAARQGQWETAIAAFERAIALDSRTADTFSQLNSIHEYQAKLAWQVALKLTDDITEPSFRLQSSADRNASATFDEQQESALRTVTALDIELYSWWHTLTEGANRDAWKQHYVPGYAAEILETERAVHWDKVSRDIRFTAKDVVAILSWEHKGEHQQRMLLLSLNGQRWQIYHEAAL